MHHRFIQPFENQAAHTSNANFMHIDRHNDCITHEMKYQLNLALLIISKSLALVRSLAPSLLRTLM